MGCYDLNRVDRKSLDPINLGVVYDDAGNESITADVQQISKARKVGSIVTLVAGMTISLNVRQRVRLETDRVLDANLEQESQHWRAKVDFVKRSYPTPTAVVHYLLIKSNIVRVGVIHAVVVTVIDRVRCYAVPKVVDHASLL